MFITFEGPEGAGKTTQAARLAWRLRNAGHACLLTREPGGTPLGDRVRNLLLASGGPPIGVRGETLLFCAARAQLVDEVIRPALARGEIVVADRYADSTLAYQGYGRQQELDALRRLLDYATGGLTPDLTFLLDLPAPQGLERKRRGASEEWNRFEQQALVWVRNNAYRFMGSKEWNRFEQEELAYHERVRQGYLELAAAEPGRWQVLDARMPPEAIEEAVWARVADRLATVN